ncbi:hypothetical protein [Marmoricola sp. RAF53]|uniref:hypothetical protein n=1 Tax=Marmoricola sp. RAF53 TaxID=3233059 RepID=UPI003F96CDE3
MRTCLVVVRAWGLSLSLPIAVGLGLLAALTWDDSAQVPTIPLPISTAVLIPVVAVLLLSATAADRWEGQTRTATRAGWRIAAARYAATQLVACTPALVGALAWSSVEPVVVTWCGVGLMSLAWTSVGRLAPLAGLPVAYLWLRFASSRSPLHLLDHALLAAVLLGGALGAAFVLVTVARDAHRFHPPRVSRARSPGP